MFPRTEFFKACRVDKDKGKLLPKSKDKMGSHRARSGNKVY